MRVQESILSAFREGMMQKEGYRKIVKRAMLAADAGFIGTRREMCMLARTYIQSANVGAQEAVFKQNEDVIKGYRRLETLDNRTCPQCAFADGLYYGKGEKRPALPIHPGCRGLYIPKTVSFRELGLDIDDLEDEARHWAIRKDGAIGEGGKKFLRFGKINGTFKEWWESLPDEDKARTGVGPVRTKLLLDGKVTWEQLIEKETGRKPLMKDLGFDTLGKPLRYDGTKKAKEVMGNIGNAYIPPDKMDKYLFSETSERGVHKGKVLTAAFGFTKDDIPNFCEQLLTGLSESIVVKTSETDYGEKVTVLTPVQGNNGHSEEVEVSWIYETGKPGNDKPENGKYTRIPRLVTALLPGKKRKK